MISDKIRPHHLERKAILYVRQSSAHQVLHNRESSALQYAMRDRLTALGWSEIEVIDDDLGRSAAGGVQRAGFERMVAQVCLGKVGAVAAREVSRFARNSYSHGAVTWGPSIQEREAFTAAETRGVRRLQISTAAEILFWCHCASMLCLGNHSESSDMASSQKC